ncbi:hypothetical protein CQW23_09648 [Capsicum baccatum]|uniref:Retrotransposon gag domain-containing protein n=1 Tax=Capsicum baccatum TaxID=33114 RepID=A0A2G2WXH6_CAPBA|nr:hypothetical protein CQW23_09648 [Capsicum baccatum]
MAMKNFQGLGGYKSVSYKDLCMFPGVNLFLGFKMSKFEKYDRHGDPIAHLRRYCNQLRGVGGKEELLMAYFFEGLSGLASEWFVDQDIDSMKKKNIESFREYAIRWHEQISRGKPSMKKSKIVKVFIPAQDETYYQYLLLALGKPFIEVLKMGEMIEDGIKTDHIVEFYNIESDYSSNLKGFRKYWGKKNEEDASAIVVGQWARSRRPCHRYSQAQSQVHAQPPHNYSQNPLYFIPPLPYPVYNT